MEQFQQTNGQASNSKKRITVFFGGRSPEHDVSIVTGLQVISALDPDLYEPIPVYISTAGQWFTGAKLLDKSFYIPGPNEIRRVNAVELRLGRGSKPTLNTLPSSVLRRTHTIEFDFAIPAFHGLYGEDGRMQGLFEMAGVPYSGMRTLASAVFMDKIATKRLLTGANVPQLPYEKIDRPAQGLLITASTLECNFPEIEFPCCVKPVHLGSSIGVAKVEDWQELSDVLPSIFRYDTTAIVEPYVRNLEEYNISVRRMGSDLITSAIERPKLSSELLDFKSKYLSGRNKATGAKISGRASEGMLSLTRYINPNIPSELAEAIRKWALVAYQSVDATGVPRVDFLYDSQAKQLWLNEINPCPGSFAYFLWEAAEEPVLFSALLEQMIEEGYDLHRRTHLPPDPTPEDARLFRRP